MEVTERMKQDVLAAAREYIASETEPVFKIYGFALLHDVFRSAYIFTY